MKASWSAVKPFAQNSLLLGSGAARQSSFCPRNNGRSPLLCGFCADFSPELVATGHTELAITRLNIADMLVTRYRFEAPLSQLVSSASSAQRQTAQSGSTRQLTTHAVQCALRSSQRARIAFLRFCCNTLSSSSTPALSVRRVGVARWTPRRCCPPPLRFRCCRRQPQSMLSWGWAGAGPACTVRRLSCSSHQEQEGMKAAAGGQQPYDRRQ